MCMFSQRIEYVSGTRIFARLDGGRQALVYEMRMASPGEVAMILPLPVAAGAGAAALDFIDLSAYPRFFDDMARCFELKTRGPRAAGAEPLAVQRVGAFEASYVPSLADFSRLDERFRLDECVWQALPEYTDYGFAVFQLAAGESRVHPMAFWFPTREPGTLFYPTVHVHDGHVHTRAQFDHILYAQGPVQTHHEWKASIYNAGECMSLGGVIGDQSVGTVLADAPLYTLRLEGMLENRDTRLVLA